MVSRQTIRLTERPTNRQGARMILLLSNYSSCNHFLHLNLINFFYCTEYTTALTHSQAIDAVVYTTLFLQWCKKGTVGCVWYFQVGGGCKSAICKLISQYIVVYFGPINSLKLESMFSCKNGVLTPICTKLIRLRDGTLETQWIHL